MKIFPFKSGETFAGPSQFFNLQHPLDAKAFVRATSRGEGLPNIDGIVMDVKNLKEISEALGLNESTLSPLSRSDARNKIRLIHPNLYHLLNGPREYKDQMLATKLFDKRIEKPIQQLWKVEKKERTSKIINEVYPYLTSRPFLELEAKNGASAFITPSVSITSRKYFTAQVNQARKMMMDSRTLLETSLKLYAETRDLINVLTISCRLIETENYLTLFRLALCNNPDQVGFVFVEYREGDAERIRKMMIFLRTFAVQSMDELNRTEPIPIHLFNVDELGYVAYSNAVCNFVSPVATSPYYHFVSKDDEDEDGHDNRCSFYHPLNMNSPKMDEFARSPCTCRWCGDYHGQLNRVQKKERPMLRRLHWMDNKNEEIRQFREAPQRIDFAVRDKLAQSLRTGLIAFFPEEPIFTIY